MRGDDFDAAYNSGYNDGFDEGKALGHEQGWREAMEHVKAEEERKRLERRAMCGRILNGD